MKTANTNLINLTPHGINIMTGPNTGIYIPVSGIVARCQSTRQQVGEVNGIPVNRTKYGEVYDLPDQQDGVCYIVSLAVAKACPDRYDLFVVDDTVRDENGKIIGVRALAQV